MKARIAALAIAAVIAVSAFTGCTSRNQNETLPEAASKIATDAENGMERIESDIERGVSEIEEKFDNNNDNSAYDNGISGIDGDYGSEIALDISQPDTSRVDTSTPESIAAMSADFSKIGALSAQKDTGFPGGPVDEQNRPSGPISYQKKFNQYGAYFIVPDSKKIYLTFDEGYENGYTSRILDTLKQKNVKAVFFVTYPYAKTEPALMKRMIEEGHTIGNHSTKHFCYPDMPISEQANDLMNLHNYVLETYGYEMSLFRPPEGAFSEQTLALTKQLGYNAMLWSFAYKDYDVKNQPLAIEASGNFLKKLHPGEITLLHAVSRTNAEILGDVIDATRKRGFEFADYFYFGAPKE